MFRFQAQRTGIIKKMKGNEMRRGIMRPIPQALEIIQLETVIMNNIRVDWVNRFKCHLHGLAISQMVPAPIQGLGDQHPYLTYSELIFLQVISNRKKKVMRRGIAGKHVHVAHTHGSCVVCLLGVNNRVVSLSL